MVFLFRRKLLKDLGLGFALIVGKTSSKDFLELCLAACSRFAIPVTKATSEMQRTYP